MIPASLSQALAYRMHTPKWAEAPTSGAGAALHGGRANRPGVAALYLAQDVGTVVKEYQQVSTLLPPGTLVSYRVTLSPVLDFRQGYRPEGVNLVLYPDFMEDTDKIEVHDPAGALPKNQDSWA